MMSDDAPRFGSLFSGIGGFDLGLERAGWECAWQVEIDPFCREVLENHWPGTSRPMDVRSVLRRDLSSVDLICGGFPCQPVSKAGKRKGTEDERWLWPEFARIVGLLRPPYVLVENVPGLLTVNGGRAMGQVLGDLAALGYDAEWDCIPAAAVGAPHLRDRVFILAYPNGGGHLHGEPRILSAGAWVQAQRVSGAGGESRTVSHAHGGGLKVVETIDSAALGAEQVETRSDAFGRRLPGARSWDLEPDVGRVAHGIPRRVDRLRALGNAIVPQVAFWLGERIRREYENVPNM